MLDVRRLRLLHELARLGTIAAVAQSLAYTPSAVSQQLAALDREAGVPLLRRSGRGVELTAAGAALAERAGQVLTVLAQAEAELAAASSELSGELRIGAYPTAVRTLLPAALVTLGARHPGLELKVTELDPAAVPDALRSGQLDVALVHRYDYVPAEPDPAVQTEPLLAETVYLASASGTASGIADGSGDPVAQCSTVPWIMGSPDTLCYLMAVRLCQAAGFRPRIRHHADDFGTVLALVAAGQGVAVVPEMAVRELPPGVELTALAARRHTLIAYRSGSGRHPAIAACAAAFRAVAEGRPPSVASRTPERQPND